ncbi:ATP-grasp domain-containing protein [Desulfonatronospira sp. MSAO_Bac3]|uniref:ATP-grasp domain-containing protein n=1 Tax=Desulfonatronospira sp. MSAO_Bac3 TaxID=2293857 RepID=UPI000FF728BD|nr:ATP-grasp domain-containing protein [Desulfonatronospira sp. MSAO_Bac3]RQD75925.1 MAG: ATP-grasp domain-containing protein [Desulfonatronospira sp. MSAO_Bac3]
MFSDQDDVLFSDLHLKEDVLYFFYVGEIKADCLNQFVAETLGKIHGRKFECISIVPDIMESYPHRNIMVINPLAKNLYNQTSRKYSCRMGAKEFACEVSRSAAVRRLAEMLIARQGRLYIHVYESLPQLELCQLPGTVLLGPEGSISSIWNNKLYQLQMLSGQVPLMDYRICKNVRELYAGVESVAQEWSEGIFVSRPYSAAGANSFIIRSAPELEDQEPLSRDTYFISRYVPHELDPTVLGVVGNEDDVFIAAIADQEIENKNSFRGSAFPSSLSHKEQAEVREHARMVGRVLGRSGYRGIFGCDFIVDNQGRIFFVEVNARKQGTTMEMCCTLENALPPGAPSLMEMEYHAVVHNRLPPGRQEIKEAIQGLFWRTYNFKVEREVVTNYFLPMDEDERELFRQVRQKGLEHRMIIVEHPGHKRCVMPGSFLGRIVAVATNREDLDRDISLGKFMLEESITIRE